jgi:hypothetical protein
MKQKKWDKLHKELDEVLDSEFGKAKLALREYLLENKEKVANDLDEMRIKSNQNDMKQTAVEWLQSEWQKKDIDISIRDLWKQAKEMEKEQIMNAINFGDERGKIQTYSTAEQYYNETFKSE